LQIYLGIDTPELIGVSPPNSVSVSLLWRRKSPWKDTNFFLDSGAFIFINQYCGYPFSTKDYMEIVKRENCALWATMDYPCEESAIRATGGNVKLHQEWTTENSRQLVDVKDGFVMVLQGRTAKDYLEHLDEVKSHGLLTNPLGVGTLCKRLYPAKMVEIVKAIGKELPSMTKIHAFGVKGSVLRYVEFHKWVGSIDTAAWAYGLRTGEYRKRIIEYRKRMEALNPDMDKYHNPLALPREPPTTLESLEVVN